MKKTILNESHKTLGAKMVEFAGYEMPVFYQGVISEHLATRSGCGIFDVSHMGQVFVDGPDANKFIDYLVPTNTAKLKTGKCLYSFMLNDKGGVVDDVIISCFNEQNYMICVNASNIEKDYSHIRNVSEKFDVEIINRSEDYSLIAIQGPKTKELISSHVDKDVLQLESFSFRLGKIFGIEAIISTTGYTGEEGYEILVENKDALTLWNSFCQIEGCTPVGLGARDTLRLEAAYSLYGQELTEDLDPISSGLSWVVDKEKTNYFGQEKLKEILKEGAPYKLHGFKVTGKGVVRNGSEIERNGEKLGWVSSGTKTPSVDYPIGLVFIKSDLKVKNGDKLSAIVRGREIEIEIMKKGWL